MKRTKIIIGFIFAVFLFSCGSKASYEEYQESNADSSATEIVSSSAAQENNKDTNRKFVRTAELKFKVKNVVKSTNNIEDITKRQNGFVTYTNLSSNIDNFTTTAISADSSLETTYYTVTNDITIRVPNTKLDTTLKEISKNIDYLDYRVIKAEDVALQILSNDLTQKRSETNGERLKNAIDNRGKKLYETAVAEEVLLNKQEQADNAKISNLSLTDKINFSTINLSIYQRQALRREIIANDKNIDEYKPGLGSKIIEALKSGWNMLEWILVFLIKLWGLFLILFIGYFVYKKIASKKNT